MRSLCTPLAVAVLAAGLAACGGGDDNSGATQAGTTPTSTKPAGASTSAPSGAGEKAKGAGVPRSKSGDNSIQGFGSEASATERAAAARALAAFLAAYAKGDGRSACSLLTASARERLGQSFGQAGAGRRCARTVSEFSSALPAQARRQLRRARLLSLRVKGNRAFAIYDAAQGKPYVAPMAKESGAWRVGALGSPLP